MTYQLSKEEQQAVERIGELEAERQAAFGHRPLIGEEQHATNPLAYKPSHLDRWYRARGVAVRAFVHPSDPKRIQVTPIGLVDAQ